MRILVTCDWFSPGTGGGAERVAYEIASRLGAAGHEVAVLATCPDGGQPFALPPGTELVAVRARSLARFLRAQVSVAPGLVTATAPLLRRLRPDVVWAHSLQFQTTPFAVVAAKRARIPAVVTAHIGDLHGVPGMIGIAARVHEAIVGRLILALATRAIAVSEGVAEHLRTIAPRLAVDVVPNGVDLARFAARAPRAHRGFRVGFLGRLVPNKGPEVAIRALRLLVDRGVDASLSFCGDGPERTRCEALAQDLGLASRVQVTGFRGDPEVWLSTIDVLVRPSLTEGMPLGLLEAMAAGVPVIASDIPGNRSLIRDGDTGLLVRPDDAHGLARALASLAADPARRAALREAASRATSAHTWERSAALTLASLERAASGVAS